ncbi:uncharacterized protein EMH_0071390 [Eimeria mitis]|uniref:Uncharacterized protein n=1 Tax=Eimeria mitis TaxID=44415 RepID=U6K4T8_9EIME|nr:uncharacterized protein EMH_0071390 [Eimeria mitis]CDJ31981.1 hypothetical protein EMH_0071390 [Eimeria mitis]
MGRQRQRLDSAVLLHPTVAPLGGSLGGLEARSLPGEGNGKVAHDSRRSFIRENGSFSDTTDHYAQVDWTPWDCCRCAAETRDAMLEKVADAFGRYAVIVYHHPLKRVAVFEPLRRFAIQNNGKLSEGTQQRSGSQNTDTKQQQVLALRRLAWGDPAAVVQQHFVEEQLRQQMQQQQQQNQWTPTGGGGRRRREGQAAAASTQQQQPQQALTHLQTQPEPVCDPERELPRVRITGLACRPPLPAGEYAFQNLCFKDSTGACEAPDGIIFVYGHKREFGSMVEYPLHTSFLLARGFPTDMLLSTRGLRLTPSGRYATATAALSLRQLAMNFGLVLVLEDLCKA